MFEFLKSDTFNIVGSLILGIGVIAVLKPICKGDDCIIQKAPSVDEVTNRHTRLVVNAISSKRPQLHVLNVG